MTKKHTRAKYSKQHHIHITQSLDDVQGKYIQDTHPIHYQFEQKMNKDIQT